MPVHVSPAPAVANPHVRVSLPDGALLRCALPSTGAHWTLQPPTVRLDGVDTALVPRGWSELGHRRVADGLTGHRYAAAVDGLPDLRLELELRIADTGPVLRLRWRLLCTGHRRLTTAGTGDTLTYLGLSLTGLPRVTEVRLAEFDARLHSYVPAEHPLGPADFAAGADAVGPLLLGTDGTHTLLVGYEHGSPAADPFLAYRLAADRTVTLRALRGAHLDGQPVDPRHPVRSVWLHVAAVAGDEDDAARAYRSFLLRDQAAAAPASRRPYLYYNSWNLQERDVWRGRHGLDAMTEERMLTEIDAAARLGVDVFVLDTGWYGRTGDWQVSGERFPRGLAPLRQRLDAAGMRLGLWVNPTVAARGSDALRRHADCVQSWAGQPAPARDVWWTEASHPMCLASRYRHAVTAELVRLARQEGAGYVKLDGVEQHGCDAAGHDHGGPDHSPRERADRAAFEHAVALQQIAEDVTAACPDVILDFDVTERGRAVGLGFLAAGRYFLLNNGPYEDEYDLPSPPYRNLFVHPGPARTWIGRGTLAYDRWVPSVCFLVHYLPDGPQSSQVLNLASLVLGHNGIWGDLASLPAADLDRMGEVLARYKRVRDDVTEAFPVRRGVVGGGAEVHEKISAATGRGVVCLFSTAAGRRTYVTTHPVAAGHWHSGGDGVTVTPLPGGQARLDADFAEPGAVLVFFGAE